MVDCELATRIAEVNNSMIRRRGEFVFVGNKILAASILSNFVYFEMDFDDATETVSRKNIVL